MKLLAALLLSLLAALPCPARTFTSAKGQTLEGVLNRVDSKNAYITGVKGNKLTVPLASLSEADRKFCEEWRAANPDIRLKVRAESFTEKGSRNTENDVSGAGNRTTVSSRTRTAKEGYRIVVSNWSSDPGAKVSGLTVEYAIVVGWMDTTAKGDKRGVKDVTRGTLTLQELNGTKEIAALTKTVGTGQSAAVSTQRYEDSEGDTRQSQTGSVYRESMDGICLVIKHGDRIVATYTTGKVPRDVQVELMK